jgi:polar amino acid transport system substrate-binding protein
LQDGEKLPGARILDGKFTPSNRRSAPNEPNDGARFLHAFVEDAQASGLVARRIDRHHIRGLSVAPPG